MHCEYTVNEKSNKYLMLTAARTFKMNDSTGAAEGRLLRFKGEELSTGF